MKRRSLIQGLAGAFVRLIPGPAARGWGGLDVRICSSLSEAAPPGGGPVLLVFFSIDCPACYDELFESRYLVDKEGWAVAVVGVFSGPRASLQAFLEKYAWTRPVVLDRRKVLFRTFKVDAVPYSVLLVGGEAAYRDDPYRDAAGRREDMKQCMIRLFTR